MTPNAPRTPLGQQQQITASVPVAWSAWCGTITSTGLYTASAPVWDHCTIEAVALSGTRYTAYGYDTILPPVVVTPGAPNYLTWKNDNGRTGLQPQETVLTPANVNSSQFGVSWTMAPDGAVWAQPLYMGGLSIQGGLHNVLFIATSNDSVYALDADNGAGLWKTSFLSAGVTAVSGSSIDFYVSQIGIMSTPVIDGGTGTLYVVAMTNENNGTSFVYRLHALDVVTGREKPGSPVVISDSGFSSVKQMQRPGLLLSDGKVYVAFGSFNDQTPYHGFLLAYDAGTLAQVASFNDTPGGTQAGIWMSGAAPAADGDGNVYISTGNGSWDGTTNFGDSVVKLSPTLQVLDYFTPYDQETLDSNDEDLGSGGPLLIPEQTGPFSDESIVCGKPRSVYLLNAEHLGGIGQTRDNIIQRLDGVIGGSTYKACFSTPAYWNNNVYFVGNLDFLKMFSLSPTTGLLSTAPVSRGNFSYSYPGAQPVISANGTFNPIVWAVDRTTGTLRAYDATNVSKALYVSAKLDTAVTWEVPTVINGHVYLGMEHKVLAFAVNSGVVALKAGSMH